MANQFIQDRSMPLVLHWLASMTPEVRAEVGDKAFLLGQLRQRGYPVLPGFVIATSMLPEFLLRSGIELPELATLPSDRPSPLQALARQLRRALLAAELPAAWLQSLVTACETMSSPVLLFRPSLSLEHGTPPAHLLLAQWCWQQPDAIAHGLKQTWAELLRARSLFYWQRLGLTWQQLHLAVLVQPARDAIASGTATSRGRLWQFQATRGLALSQERGETIPDTYQVEAATGRWQQRRGGHQSRIYRLRTRPPAVSADCVEIMALNEHDSLPMAITPDQQQQLLAIAVRLNADGVDVPGWEWLATPVALETEIILTQLHDQNPLVQSTSTAGPGSLRLLGIGAATPDKRSPLPVYWRGSRSIGRAFPPIVFW
ncbi:MAG: hypothetical protein HC838_05120 [Spirulinaceae cyanobacterium RM2_2_10]|nr:hypothetical protein [Spirulinaceae cyanobacterium RM2_2_10]